MKSLCPYDRLSVILHWIIAGLVLGQTATGFLFFNQSFESDTYQLYYYWHRSLGEAAFVVILLSALWRQLRAAVQPAPDLPWRMATAAVTKQAITILLIVVPGSKLLRGAYGIGWEFFGLTVAAPWPANFKIAALLTGAHLWSSLLLLFLALVHAGAALWHGLVMKDGVLARMWR